MARRDRTKKLKTPTENQTDHELRAHIASLGLKTTAEYAVWCAGHGFSPRLHKNWRQRLKERSFCTQTVALAHLSQKKRELRKPNKCIEAIFNGELDADHVTQPHLKQICHAYDVARSCRRTRQALLELLLQVSATCDLFDARPVIAEYGRQPGNSGTKPTP
jgi:hypothetical protein